MIGLTGTRVIVVDDDEDEALPILKAFAREGIPTAFFDGRIRGLPPKDKRFKGIRLAILDMDLVGGGVRDVAKAAALVKTLSSILSPDNGPYAVLAWTKHPELRDAFEQQVFERAEIPKPILTVMIEKAECQTARGGFDLRCLSSKIREALAQASPLLFLQAWEGECFNAATQVTNVISSLATQDAGDLRTWRELWKTIMLGLMRAMAVAVAEKNLDAETCLRSLYSSLNPLHADRMESNTALPAETVKTQSTEILAATQDIGIERKSKLNSMLHLASDNLRHFAPGNIYKFPEKGKPKWVPNTEKLVDELMQPAGDRTAEIKAQILGSSVRLLVEASAPCDHAQQNVRFSRLIAGMAIPVAEKKRIKSGGFVWTFGPLFLETPVASPGQYQLYFSGRHVLGPEFQQITHRRAVIRLRGQALADLQAWFGHHVSRPGVMMLH